jgi:iron complex outermembrane recepter protein
MWKQNLIALCAFIALSSPQLLAQPYPVTGRVLDSSGGAIGGARVTLSGNKVRMESTTQDNGAFQFEVPAPGRYEIRAEMQLFRTAVQEIAVGSSSVEVEIKMAPSGLNTSVVVTDTVLDYKPEESTTATRLALPLIETPQAVSVVSQKVLQDRQVLAVHEIADNVAGLRQSSGYGGSATAEFNIRGFAPPFYGGNVLRDGFRDYGFLSPRDVQGIESIEVLKGPSSILYGVSEVGGIVNTTSKRPLPEHRRAIGIQGGSWARVRPTLDFTGPLNRSETLLYRLNFAYDGHDSYRDFHRTDVQYLAPAITWRMSEAATLRFGLELQRYDYTHDGGLPPVRQSLLLPVDRFLGEPDYSGGLNRQVRASIFYDHELSRAWHLRSAINGLVSHSDLQFLTYRGLQADGQTVNRNTVATDELTENYNWQNDLSGRFSTGPLQHNFLAGFELARWQFTYYWNQGTGPHINIFNPVYGARPATRIPLFAEQAWANFAGIYLQDQIRLSRQWLVLVGVRTDFVDQRSGDPSLSLRLNSASTFNAAPRAALMWQPVASASAYFSYTTSFFPQYGASVDRRAFPPERGRQFEIGYKHEMLDKRLLATISAFQIWKDNVITPDINNPPFSITTGQQTSKGIEFEMTGRLRRNWSLAANYAFTQAYVNRDNSIRVGALLPRTPRHAPGVLSTWLFENGPLSGLTLGGGVYAATERTISVFSPVILDGYTRGEVFAAYARNQWRLRVNVKNVGNTRWFDGGSFGITPQAPRHVVAGLDYSF